MELCGLCSRRERRGTEVDGIRRLPVKGGGASCVEEVHGPPDAVARGCDALVGVQVDLLELHRPPQALNEDMIAPCTTEVPWLARLWNPLPAARARLIPSRSQVATKLLQESHASHCHANAFHRFPVDSGSSSAFVRGDLPPRTSQVAQVGNPIPQLSIAAVRICFTPLIVGDVLCHCRCRTTILEEIPSPDR